MTRLYDRLQALRREKNVSWELLEQDYLLSWMLAGIAATPELKKLLVFKGGTALKKMYFGDYRFSQDLDFSVLEVLPEDIALENLIQEACHNAQILQGKHGYPLKISSQWYTEKKPHPEGQKALSILAQFPWHRDSQTRIMIEITMQETIILPPVERIILHHGYSEVLTGSLTVYTLEEVIAEKCRTILQYAMKLHERGWARSRARDYYDLWSILTMYKQHLDLSIIPHMVIKKCHYKDIVFSGPSDLFTPVLLDDLETAWEHWLGPIVPFLPEKNKMLGELRQELDVIWSRFSQSSKEESQQQL